MGVSRWVPGTQESNVGLLGVSAGCESQGKERELRCMANYTLSFSDFVKREKKKGYNTKTKL